MKTRGLTHLLTWGAWAYVTSSLIGTLVLAGITIAGGEWAAYMIRRKRKYIEWHNRRDCIVIAESWPGSDGDGPRLNDVDGHLYEYQPAKKVEHRAGEWAARLHWAENDSRAEGLREDLVLPIITVYRQAGPNRSENRDQYRRRLEQIIRDTNNRYHNALWMENGGMNYHLDYILRR